MEHKHKDRIAVVGGTSGIGRASVERLASAGYDVIAIGRDRAKLTDLERSTATASGRVTAVQADGGDADAMRKLFQEHGPLNGLVIAASGAKGAGPFTSLSLDVLRRGFEEKFWVHLTTLQAALGTLAPDASITLITAVSARSAAPGTAGLGSINGALETIVPTLARELAPLRVNAVSPGMIDTPWWNAFPDDVRKQWSEQYSASVPLHRVGRAEEVAHAVQFLIENRYVTGSVVEVDGGAHLV
ncbi:MAG: SDR family oxidoreductase [Candidatus Eremiobacteraeota bacterium]|nr:SDR family oxidoreductase [Candidatus Eremiobacteraeota bacterium]MBV9408672.1 SDR family oxidoreductase [Candidatus Eremiobacteraeota bacterium]